MYWKNRQEELYKGMETSETILKKRMSNYYNAEARKLESKIASYYQMYGTDNVIEYRALMAKLSQADIDLLMQQMDVFAIKYPQYSHLLPVRQSIYNLNRLEGLQQSVIMQQLEIGAMNNVELLKFLENQAVKGVNATMDLMGCGKNYYTVNSNIVKTIVNTPWTNGNDFSESIWRNTSKLANYLNTDFAQAVARGDSYQRIVRDMVLRFNKVSRNDIYRLVYTEGTFVMAESSMKPFEGDFEEYKLLPERDGRECEICRGLSEKAFKIKDRIAGINFPALHTWCRCTFEIVVDNWDTWLDNYVAKHNNKENGKMIKRRLT
jgi:phage putative head morphogenesis protein, SPP1 gp7 family